MFGQPKQLLLKTSFVFLVLAIDYFIIFRGLYMALYKRCYLIFIIGAFGYCFLEILWRGYTHPSMGIAGGLCLIGIYYINKLNCSRFIRAFLSTLLISFTEFIFGVVLNIILHLNIWNYSSIPLNFMGQICLPFSLLWFILSYCIILFLDYSNCKFL